MKISCPNCAAEIVVDQPYFYHAAFTDLGFMYCDRDSTVLVFSAYDKVFSSIVGEKVPWALSPLEKEAVEKRVRRCPCGGRFAFDNRPRCTECGASLEKAFPSAEHYVIIAKEIDGENEDIWTREPGVEKPARRDSGTV